MSAHPIAEGARPVHGDVLTAWGKRCLEKLSMPSVDAERVAESLVQTSLWGVDSHGVARLPHYFERLKRGSINAVPAIAVRRTGPCTAQVDGDRGHGIVVAFRANEEAIALARRDGVGVVGVSDSSHCGAMALYTRQAARAELVGIAFTHADSVAAPHGGSRAFFGTNPLSLAFPRQGGEPVCLDMATTSIPWNRVMNARREAHPLPEGVTIDGQGRPTTDAHAARALLPLGGAGYGHKGYALALVIDLLCGPLNGNPFGPRIPPMFEDLGIPRHIGAFFIVMDPMRFAGGSALSASVAEMAQALAGEPGSPRMPGDPELDREAQRRASGVPIEPALAEEFRQWSGRLGVEPPL